MVTIPSTTLILSLLTSFAFALSKTLLEGFISAKSRVAACKVASPNGVNRKPRRPRSQSVPPSFCSSAAMCVLKVDWERLREICAA